MDPTYESIFRNKFTNFIWLGGCKANLIKYNIFQLAYQTYHADLNQGNRNLNYSEHTANKAKRSDWKNYILACLTSLSLSLLARNLTAGLIMKVTTGGSLVLLNALLTYLATSTGSVFNTFLMRDAEL